MRVSPCFWCTGRHTSWEETWRTRSTKKVLHYEEAGRNILSSKEKVRKMDQDASVMKMGLDEKKDVGTKDGCELPGRMYHGWAVFERLDAIQARHDQLRASHDLIRASLDRLAKQIRTPLPVRPMLTMINPNRKRKFEY